MNECARCGHQWLSRAAQPVACPRCKSYQWKVAADKKVAEKGLGLAQEVSK